MTNTRTKLTILILMLTLSFSVFAKGDGERYGKVVKDENQNPIMTVSSEKSFGKIVYKFQDIGSEAKLSNVVVKVGDTYYNQDGEPIEDQAKMNEIFGNLVIDNSKTVDIDGDESEVANASLDLTEETKAALDTTRSENPEISINSTIDKVNLDVWAVHSDGNIFKIKTSKTPEFFEGEKDFFVKLFGDDSALSYQEQVIFFLSTFFIEDRDEVTRFTNMNIAAGRDEFVEIVCTTLSEDKNKIPNITDVVTQEKFDSIYPELIKHQNIFKGDFISHFDLSSEFVTSMDIDKHHKRAVKLPFIDIKMKSFDGLYSTDPKKRSPYITAYLAYAANENTDSNKNPKPLLSYVINKRISDKGIDVSYDYNQYRQITPAEGINIAKAALRYMTWGVEYTPYANESVYEENSSANKVYKDNFTNIEEWVLNKNIDPSLRSSNYFGKDITIISNPNSNGPLGELYNKKLVTSPFNTTPGNPISYAPMGIDTPKTFNYKMYEQNKARQWMIERYKDNQLKRFPYPNIVDDILVTTLAEDFDGTSNVSVYDSYINEIDLYREADEAIILNNSLRYNEPLPQLEKEYQDIKPFIPGLESEKYYKYSRSRQTLYHPNKFAGVDSIGLLMGSITMSGIDGNILNVFNTKVDFKLDSYNSSGTEKNPEGFPNYHIKSDNDDQLKKPYRFTKSDIERSTILLPDLRMARPGDILVNYSKEEPHIGIILTADFDDLLQGNAIPTAEQLMEKITVISIKSGFRMANVGLWKNAAIGVYGGFAQVGKEKSYHLRRLVTLPTEVDNLNNYEEDQIELFNNDVVNLYVDIEFEKKSDKEVHWIPNTGELLKFNSIKITGNNVTEEEEDSNIIILPPIDQYYHEQSNSSAANDTSNIYRNKGKGLKFYALDGDYAILLATFEKLTNTTTIEEGQSSYDIDYAEDIFNTDTGKAEDGFRLYVENNKLKFKIGNSKILTKFGVRPFEENIRPGDDFLLRFGLERNTNIIAQADGKDFIATYDKKLLWRANLFIDDRNSNRNDWNDDFSWNAPPTNLSSAENKGVSNANHYKDYGFKKIKDHKGSNDNNIYDEDDSEIIWYGKNLWNREMQTNAEAKKFKLNGNWEDLSELNPGNGKQRVKFPQAVYNHRRSTYNRRVVKNQIVYNFIRTTTPFEYYNQMVEQFEAMEDMRDNFKTEYENAKTIYFESETDETKLAYNNALKEYEKDNSDANKAVLDAAKAVLDASKTPENTDLYEKTKSKYDLYSKLDSKTLLPPLGNIKASTTDYKELFILWSRYAPNSAKPAAKDSLNYGTSCSVPFEQPEPVSGPLKWLVKNGAGVWENKLNTISYFENYILTPESSIPTSQIYSNEQAGIDCGGLIYISEAYDGTTYVSHESTNILANTAQRYVHDVGFETSGYEDVNNNNLHKIMSHADFTGMNKSNKRRMLIPGDVMFYTDSYHVAMVQSVNIVDGKREIELSDIILIESTHHGGLDSGPLFGAGNKNNLGFYDKKGKDWIIGRIKHNEQ